MDSTHECSTSNDLLKLSHPIQLSSQYPLFSNSGHKALNNLDWYLISSDKHIWCTQIELISKPMVSSWLHLPVIRQRGWVVLECCSFLNWVSSFSVQFVYIHTFCVVIIAYSLQTSLDYMLLFIQVWKYLPTIECSLCWLEMELNTREALYINRQLKPSTSSTR